MSKKLIVVADDFGFSEAYNYGVIKAYKEGVVCRLIDDITILISFIFIIA